MAWQEALLGTPSSIKQIDRYNPQQQGNMMEAMNLGMQGIRNPYAGFEPIAQQARTQFQQNTVPSLAERFSSMGGSLSSPSFAGQLGQAGAGMETGLAALQSQYGMQNRGQMMNLMGMGLNPLQENYMMPGQEGFVQKFLPGILQAVMHAITGMATGGASLPGSIANYAGNSMGGVNNLMANMPQMQQPQPFHF